MIVEEYIDGRGRSPFGDWFSRLNAQSAARVTVALTRMSVGNLSNAKPVGQGVSEYKIDFGPGYRVYFGQVGSTVIVLLVGGTKQRQQKDIEAAQLSWADFKARKKRDR